MDLLASKQELQPMELASKKYAKRKAAEDRMKFLMTKKDSGGIIDAIIQQEEEKKAKYYYDKRYV